MSLKPKVSCLCVTWGKYGFLEKSLSCFLSQDYPNKELIILNCHPVPIVCKQRNVRVVNEPDLRTDLTEYCDPNWRRAIELADGDYVNWWDDDDLYLPWDLSQRVEHIQKRQCEVWKAQKHWHCEGYKDFTLTENTAECSLLVNLEALRKKGWSRATNSMSNWPDWVYQEKKMDDVGWRSGYVYCWASGSWHISGMPGEVSYADRLRSFRENCKDTGERRELHPANILGIWRQMIISTKNDRLREALKKHLL